MENGRHKRMQRGFTMIEVVVTVALTSVLMMGLMSAMLIAGKALPEDGAPIATLVQTRRLADQIAEEVRFAKYVAETGTNAVTFTVADRDTDGSPETISYAWSGTPGDPLTRQYNHAAAVAVLDNVQQFALTYDVTSVIETYPAPPVDVPETLLTNYDPTFSMPAWALSMDWPGMGQYFTAPTVPAGATTWRLRVWFKVAAATPKKEQTRVQIRPAEADNTPSATVLAEQILDEATLSSSYAWQEFVFDSLPLPTARQGYCAVLEYASVAATEASLWYGYSPIGPGGVVDQENGQPWVYNGPAQSMRHAIYSDFNFPPPPPQTATRDYVTAIRMTLKAGSDGAPQLDTSIGLLNTPEVLSAVWEYEGNTDPTTLDMNGDGLGDWNLRWGGSITPTSITGGVLQVSGTTNFDLDTVPDNPFTELTTVEFRYRCTEVTNSGIYFWINSDYTGGTFMPVVSTLKLQADATQDLTVNVGGNNVVALTDLPPDFITVRLLIDPGVDTVNIKVEGADQGTFAYTPYPPTSDPQRATLNHWRSGGEWDSVRIRVGGTGS